MRLDELERFRIERDGRVTTVLLNRPEIGNALDDLMHTEMARLFAAIDADEETDIAVISGAGDAFCVGGEISKSRRFASHGDYVPTLEARIIVDTALAMTTPVIAAVNGDALGFGALLPTLADVSFAEPGARVAVRHVAAGVVPGNGPVSLWPALIGPSRAKLLLMGAAEITGAEAVAMGLFTQLSEPGQTLADAQALAGQWAQLPQQALRLTKRAINLHALTAAASTLSVALGYEADLMSTPEYQANLAARLAD